MSQLFIVTTPQNSGLGTPLATAFNYTNSNFGELYARYQTNVPTSLSGQEGDVAGMYATDSTFFFYCFADYDGSSTIWAQVTQVGNVSVTRIVNGTSNVDIVAPNSNVTVGVGGVGNVLTLANTGAYVQGVVSAIGNISGSYILGNGSQLSGLPQTYTDADVTSLLSNFGPNNISSTGNVTAGYFLGDGSFLQNLTAASITGTVANAAFATAAGTAGTVTTAAQPNVTSVGTLSSVSVSGNVTGGNVRTAGTITASGNIVTEGFFVGNFTGNIVANITNIPGPGGAVVFNDGAGNAAATAGLVFDNSSPNVLTVLGSYSATANITGNLVTANLISGTLTTAAQPNITSVGTLSSVSVTGNVVGGNLTTGGIISATGNVTGGNLSATNGITASSVSVTGTITSASVIGGVITGASASVTGNVTATNLFGTVGTAIQNNITSVGTLSSLTVSANIQGGNLRTTGLVSASGNVVAAGNVRGGNLTIVTDIAVGGNVSATEFQGVSVSVVGNITGNAVLSAGIMSAAGNVTVGNLLSAGSILTTGNITGGNIVTSGTVNSTGTVTGGNLSTGGTISSTGNITSNANILANVFSGDSLSVSGNISGTNLTGNLITSAQPNITSVGTLSALSVTGNVQGGNLRTAGQVSAAGNVTGQNLIGTSLFGAVATASQTAITAIGTLSTLSVSGNITSGNLSVNTGTVRVGNIVNTNANGVGNIGTASLFYNTVFAKATSAQYADLAENYTADGDYPPGTVVIFGGEQEVTVTTEQADERVAGAVSRNPAHLMNAGMPGLPIALRGRVDVRVIGPVTKGDSLVTSSIAGVAVSAGRSRDYAQAVFAKAIETNLTSDEKIITAVIL
jgi:hypothetical protein